jgi:DnaK suppressor protein
MELTEADLARFRERLAARRVEIASLSQQTKDDRAPVQLDQASVGRLSRMDAIQQQQMALAADRRRLQEIAAIDAALARIAAGEFGDCARCGEPIAPARLAIDPTTPFCVRCAG